MLRFRLMISIPRIDSQVDLVGLALLCSLFWFHVLVDLCFNHYFNFGCCFWNYREFVGIVNWFKNLEMDWLMKLWLIFYSLGSRQLITVLSCTFLLKCLEVCCDSLNLMFVYATGSLLFTLFHLVKSINHLLLIVDSFLELKHSIRISRHAGLQFEPETLAPSHHQLMVWPCSLLHSRKNVSVVCQLRFVAVGHVVILEFGLKVFQLLFELSVFREHRGTTIKD